MRQEKFLQKGYFLLQGYSIGSFSGHVAIACDYIIHVYSVAYNNTVNPP